MIVAMPALTLVSPFRAIGSVISQPITSRTAGLEARHLFTSTKARFEVKVPALAALSHEIEKEALSLKLSGGEVFVGFQRFSRFVPSVARRYLQLAERNKVYVFGCGSPEGLPTHPSLVYVSLEPNDPLCDEWFVIVNSAAYQVAFSALDLIGFEMAEHLNERLFSGAKVSDPSVVHHLSKELRRRAHSS